MLTLEDRRATPCEIHEDGKDYVKTNKWIVFGHHFAAISGPGPLVGPVLAAQFGYLPGTLWIIIGVALGGAVQDFIILFASIRRDGRSLAQMVKEELNATVGFIGVVAILAIMIILLAVLSRWSWSESAGGIAVGSLHCRGHHPDRHVHGRVFARIAGRQGAGSFRPWAWCSCCSRCLADNSSTPMPTLHAALLCSKSEPLAWGIIFLRLPRQRAAGVAAARAARLPEHVYEAVARSARSRSARCSCCRRALHMPAISKFVDGSGPVVPGKLFPFCFRATIACGAISGFHHAHFQRRITPEDHYAWKAGARPVGYGAMCLESLVAIMAMIAACTLDPGVYLAMNIPGNDPAATQAAAAAASGLARQLAPSPADARWLRDLFPVTVSPAGHERSGHANGRSHALRPHRWRGDARRGHGHDLRHADARSAGSIPPGTTSPSCSRRSSFSPRSMPGTRAVAAILLQDAFWAALDLLRLGDTKNFGAGMIASALIVAAWGFFPVMDGVHARSWTAGSRRSGRSSASPISSWPASRSVWPRRCC